MLANFIGSACACNLTLASKSITVTQIMLPFMLAGILLLPGKPFLSKK